MDLASARQNMVQQQIRACGVLDEKILSLCTHCPREVFVPDNFRSIAYADMQIPLSTTEVMLQPNFLARILNALRLLGNEQILEIGTGSGYLTALLAQLGHSVTSVEIANVLAIRARNKLASIHIKNVEILHGNASLVLQGSKSFDIVVFTGSLESLPQILANQTKCGGRLFAVIGQQPVMQACIFTRIKEDEWIKDILFETVIPPLREMDNVATFKF